jgi:hypothetical protein
MDRRKIVVSVDYEIFGNGTGDVRQHIIDPTERMAKLCEKYQAPLTVFFEMEEYLAFERHAPELRRAWGYDGAALMRDQARDLVRRGHDLQLHLHPEWQGVKYADGWPLNERHGTVDSLFETAEETTQYIGERQQALSALSGRPVRCYRAGAFSAQPGEKLITALSKNGFTLDSSVVHGLQRNEEHVALDYRNAPKGKTLWRVQEDVARETTSGPLWELPIGSVAGRRINQVTFGRLKAKFSRNVPKERQKQMVKKLGIKRNPISLLRFLSQPVPLKFDYHNVTPGKLVNWIRNAPQPPAGLPDIVVLIGHTKEHIDDAAFEKMLQLVAADPKLEIVSFDAAAKLLPPTKSAAEAQV